jgi:NADH dehydrogenase (ubiquinone) 1 alpha subcomplex subunit 9
LPFSPRDRESIYESVKKSDIVINMIGKHYETKHLVPTRRADGKLSRVNYDFEEVHATIPRTIAEVSKEAGVKAFIHVSALSADLNSQSKWSQTKAKGELAVREIYPDSVSASFLRPFSMLGASMCCTFFLTL